MSIPNLEEWSGSTREALAELEADGFSVISEPHESDLPEDLRDLRPDFVLRRGSELVVVEVSTRGQARSAQLDRLAEVVSGHTGWRFILLWAGEDASPVPSANIVEHWLNNTRVVAGVAHDAAILSVWVAVEAALEIVAARLKIEGVRGGATRLIPELFSLGVLSERQYQDLNNGRDLRDGIAHGREAIVDERIVTRLASLAEWLASDQFVAVDRMTEDFLAAYEDPAHHVPYDSAEGGYQYVSGGPFDAFDVLSETYPNAPEEDLREAADILSSESDAWVRQDRY
ncbi:HEPN-associated N-terminal domain-containing protein [Promicromonospora sp. MS192]|uniref:HEPN-associated N-terminal domain-containing protein n=1 Tax=Promicromonospora sp. MS192 TaxID=3412684 RepID=UPI003C2FBF9C